jgi:hypothetical protein
VHPYAADYYARSGNENKNLVRSELTVDPHSSERDPDHLYQQVLREVMARAEGLREVAKAIG